jgi:glutamate dehydrogenase (NAD(P)+)
MVPGLDSLDGARVAIQGLGQVGAIAMRLFHEAGACIVAVSDSSGGIARPAGLDPSAVLAHKRERGSVIDLAGTTTISNEELLACDCDILIPAALECQLRADNAPRVKAKLVVEAANGPSTPEADNILQAKNVVVLPDIVANGGGVIVSYFEWVQNLENQQWDLDKVERLLEQRVNLAVDATVDCLQSLEKKPGKSLARPGLRDAALVTAITRVVEVVLKRDIWM